jgi:hypothetical protein
MKKQKTPQVLTGEKMFPLKKGDLVVQRRNAFYLHRGYSSYYVLSYLEKGGKKPSAADKLPIYVEDIVAVVRPGWRITSSITEDSVEDAIRKAWEENMVYSIRTR